MSYRARQLYYKERSQLPGHPVAAANLGIDKAETSYFLHASGS